MIYFKIHNQAVTAADFQVSLKEIKIKCNSKGIDNPVLVLDNARIHYTRNLVLDDFMVFYLPLYCLFLNLIENYFSQWKNNVIRRACTTETQLKRCSENSFTFIYVTVLHQNIVLDITKICSDT